MFYNIMSNHLHLWATCLCCYYINYLFFYLCKLCQNYSFGLLVCICIINEKFSSCFFCAMDEMQKKNCVFNAIYI